MKQRLDVLQHKVIDMVKQIEDQSDIIDKFQSTVAAYRRLYEEEVTAHRVSQLMTMGPIACLKQQVDGSKDEAGKLGEEETDYAKFLEAELNKARQEVSSLYNKHAHADVQATFTRNEMVALRKEYENQCKEMRAVLARNVEFSQTITIYQQKLWESSMKLQAFEELGYRQKIVAMLEKEKARLVMGQKTASDEVASLSVCVRQLQASLDNIKTVAKAREGARAIERKELEDELNKLQKECAQAKPELEVKKAALRIKLKEVQELNIVCEPKSLTKRLKTPSWRCVREEGWHNIMKVQCPVLAQMSPSAFEQIMQGPEHPNLTSSGKLVVCGDSRQVYWAGGVLQEVALEPMQSRRPLQDLVTNKLGTRSVQHKVVVVDVGTNNLV
ncbi:hypothetical protein CY35_05G001400 [Sphagnum magellanicum]|nr:hypothetical protein CY35_05G001400 [Sphagnum magellanicum]KAH9561103.1 hypothetical protein CY35_05G001400 [Sphagnum magellanicum]